MTSVKRDYTAAVIIGIVAAILSKIMITNLDLSIPYFAVALVLLVMPPAGIFVARFIGKKSMGLYQFVKFGETGGLNTFIDLGVMNLLILVTGFSAGIYYSIFKGISFLCAVTNSYLWNKHWVFESKEKGRAQESEFVKFILVSLGGLLVNVGAASIILFLSKSTTSLSPNIMANIAAALAFIITMAFNFFGYKIIVFAKRKK